MLDTLAEHATLANAMASFGMLLVWLFYAQLLLSNYRRQLRPKILINQGFGTSLNSRCFVANMSKEAIHLDVICGELETESTRHTAPITDREPPPEEATSQHQGAGQGPLQSGESRDIGSFRDLMYQIARSRQLPTTEDRQLDMEDIDIRALTLQIIANYGPEDQPVGARRRFTIRNPSPQPTIRPDSADTQQFVSRRDRKQVRSWFSDTLAD